MLKRWSDFRRTQREILRASNVPTPIERDGGDEPAQAAEPSLLTDTLPLAADPPEPGRHGARIEDIVVITDDGSERLNQRPRELAVLPTQTQAT